MKTAVQLVAFAVALSGQVPSRTPVTANPKQQTGTRIGPHRLGESFNEWLTIEKIDMDAVCASGSRSIEFPSNHSQDDYLKYLNDLQQSREDAYLCNDLRPIRETGTDDYEDRRGLGRDNGYVDRWTFVNGKLAGKQSVYSTEITTKEFGFLKEAYGPPTTITKIPQQNAFGARWNDILMTWHLLGGTTLYLKALGGPKDDLIITFISREHAKAPISHEPNPYLLTKP
jgi:hypothetical protein